MKRITCSIYSIFISLFISIGLYLTPLDMVSLALPDWSAVYIEDPDAEMMRLQPCKRYFVAFQKFEPNEFSILGDEIHNITKKIWIEVNNKEDGISCLNTLKDRLLYSYCIDHQDKIYVEECIHLKKNEFHIDHSPLKKTNGVRYIFFTILIFAFLLEITGVRSANEITNGGRMT